MDKLQTTETQLDKDTAAVITEAYQRAVQAANGALLQVAACGLLLWEKQRTTKHGEFLPWLDQHCPEVPQRTAYRWIDTAKNLCQVLKLKPESKHGGLPLHQVLLLPGEQLDGRAAKIRQRVESRIDGRSANQLSWKAELKQREAKGQPKPSKATLKRQAAEQAGLAFVTRMQELRQQQLINIMPVSAKAQVFEEFAEFTRYMKAAQRKGTKA
ncbi:MAG: hypothetical protein ACPGVU_05115 [Limisphaerales bacterium]